MDDKKQFSLRLNAFLFSEDFPNFEAFLGVPINDVERIELKSANGIDGIVFVKRKPEKALRAPWAADLDGLTGKTVEGLEVSSSSAILFARAKGRVVAFSFGYGRFLLNEEHLVSDFGIRTALNTLNHDTLRSVDLFSLEQEPIQKRSQATKTANINNFGIDVSRDVLKAVTGDPIVDIKWRTISGGGPQYSFTSKVSSYNEVHEIAESLVDYYDDDSYRDRFGWVDNIQRIRNSHVVEKLNELLVEKMKAKLVDGLALTLPGAEDWKEIYGFSYTNAKKELQAAPSIEDYYNATDLTKLSIDKIKEHKLFCHKTSGENIEHSIYESIYFECIHKNKLHILFGKQWFSIDQSYSDRVEEALKSIPISTITFPEVQRIVAKRKKKSKPAPEKSDSTTKKKLKTKTEDLEENITLESEGDYNARTAKELGLHLMDRKLVSSVASASPIEVCDLLSSDGKFIHAKHRKGYSSGLSHLFAQGRVSAELLLNDQEFRKGARGHLNSDGKKLIPEGKFKAGETEIVFLVLGADPKTVLKDLPFFSKVNLNATYTSLTGRNFQVSVCGAPVQTK